MNRAGQIAREQLAALLEFVSPGILHSLGNQIFAIQGNAQVLGIKTEDIGRERRAILSASKEAQESLDILRCLTSESGEEPRQQAGLMLRRICEAGKIPLREAGLRCSFEQSSVETPMSVEPSRFARCVLEVMRCIRAELPSGFDGDLHVDLAGQQARELRLSFEVQQKPSLLPFPLNMAAVCERAHALTEACTGTLECLAADARLLLRLPINHD